MTVAPGLVALMNFSMVSTFLVLAIGSSHMVMTTKSAKFIRKGPKKRSMLIRGWLAPTKTMCLSVLMGGMAAPLPSMITKSDSTSLAIWAPLFMLVIKTWPTIPPPQRRQPMVSILLIKASSQWSEAAWIPLSDCSIKN